MALGGGAAWGVRWRLTDAAVALARGGSGHGGAGCDGVGGWGGAAARRCREGRGRSAAAAAAVVLRRRGEHGTERCDGWRLSSDGLLFASKCSTSADSSEEGHFPFYSLHFKCELCCVKVRKNSLVPMERSQARASYVRRPFIRS